MTRRVVGALASEVGQQLAYVVVRTAVDTVPPIVTINIGRGIQALGTGIEKAGRGIWIGGAYISKYGYEQRDRVQEAFRPHPHRDAHLDGRLGPVVNGRNRTRGPKGRRLSYRAGTA